MPFIIRKGEQKDVLGILTLIKELAEYERAPNEVTNTIPALQQDGFGPHPLFQTVVAELDNRIIGMALFYTAYSTWKGKYIYLDDLIITETFRRKGIGNLLLEEVLKEAAREKVALVKWQVLAWNESAIEFYKKRNVVFDNEWIDCKLFQAHFDAND